MPAALTTVTLRYTAHGTTGRLGGSAAPVDRVVSTRRANAGGLAGQFDGHVAGRALGAGSARHQEIGGKLRDHFHTRTSMICCSSSPLRRHPTMARLDAAARPHPPS